MDVKGYEPLSIVLHTLKPSAHHGKILPLLLLYLLNSFTVLFASLPINMKSFLLLLTLLVSATAFAPQFGVRETHT